MQCVPPIPPIRFKTASFSLFPHTQAVTELAKLRRQRESIEESDSISSMSESDNYSDGRGGEGVATNRLARIPTVSTPRPAGAVSPRPTVKAPDTTGESLCPLSRHAVTKTPDGDVERSLTRIGGIVDGDDDRAKGEESTGWDGRVCHRGGIAPEPARSIHKAWPTVVGEPSPSACEGTTKMMTPRRAECGDDDHKFNSSDQGPVESKTVPTGGKITTPRTMSENCVQGSLYRRRMVRKRKQIYPRYCAAGGTLGARERSGIRR